MIDSTSWTSSTRAIFLSVVVVTSSRLPVFLVPTTALLIEDDLGRSTIALGVCLGAFFLVAALMSMPAGRYAVRSGPRAGMRIGGSLTLICLIGIAALAESWPTVIGFLAVGGVGSAFVEPAVNQSLFQLVPRRRQGMAYAVKQSANPLAVMVGGLAVPALAVEHGWRSSFVAGALLAAFALFLGTSLSVPSIQRQPRSRTAPGRRKRNLLLCMAGLGACGAVVGNAVGGFAPGAVGLTGIGQAHVGLLIAACSMATVLIRLTFGVLADHRVVRLNGSIATLLVVGAIGCGLIATGERTLVIIGCFAAFMGGWGWPGLLHLWLAREFGEETGAATGIMLTGVAAGAGVGPVLFAASLAALGGVTSWSLAAATGLLGLCLSLTAGRIADRTQTTGSL